MSNEAENMDELMDMPARRHSWHMFITLVQWSSLLLLLGLAYPTMTVILGIQWALSLVVLAVFGAIAGTVMKMGRSFMVVLAGLVVMAVLIQLMVTIFRALI